MSTIFWIPRSVCHKFSTVQHDVFWLLAIIMALFKSNLMIFFVLTAFLAICFGQCSDSSYDENSEFDGKHSKTSEILNECSTFWISVIDGVKIYPKELRCAIAGGMCVEASKCKTLVSARGLCISSFYQGVECCYEGECRNKLSSIPVNCLRIICFSRASAGVALSKVKYYRSVGI